jgi:Domain of unknown function (DUF4955)/Pectate lyase superfamily protein
MNKFLNLSFLLCLPLALSGRVQAEGIESVHWRAFKEAADRSPAGILTDFSYAGYEHGEEAIPDVAGPVFKVTDYGAVADDDGCDEEAIRKTVAAAEEAGGGVVLFPPGKFLVWCDRNKAEPIRVGKSGVVIRGAGSSAGGTVIRSVHSGYRTGPYPVPKGTKDAEGKDDWSKIPYIFMFEPAADKESSGSVAVTGPIKRGSFEVPVESSEGFLAGEWVLLKAKTHKLDNELLAGLELHPTWKRMIEDGAGMSEIHRVKEVRDKVLVLEEPVLINLRADFGVKVSHAKVIEQVGVEDVALQGGWRGAFVHHRSGLDDEGWDGIQFKGVANGWVRRCAFLNLNTGIYLRNSACCSLLQNRFAGTMGHYDTAVRSDSSFNLMGLTDEQSAPQHGASTGNRSAGTVVWRWRMTPASTVDSHGNGPYATLIDRVDGGTMTRSGGPAPSFPNHLRWMVFWNFSYDGNDDQPVNFWNYVKGKEAKFVKPLFVGLHGKPLELKADALEDNESPGAPVLPESLYEAQLELRLGKAPEWVGPAKTEWETLRAQVLPPFAIAEIAGQDLHKENFPLGDLLKDWSDMMAAQELGWAVPLELTAPVPEVSLDKDYVLLRTILQAMATYASPLPVKDEEKTLEAGKSVYALPPALKVEVVVTDQEVTISLPIQSNAKAQVKNKAALLRAEELAPVCGASLLVEPTSLKLTVPR